MLTYLMLTSLFFSESLAASPKTKRSSATHTKPKPSDSKASTPAEETPSKTSTAAPSSWVIPPDPLTPILPEIAKVIDGLCVSPSKASTNLNTILKKVAWQQTIEIVKAANVPLSDTSAEQLRTDVNREVDRLQPETATACSQADIAQSWQYVRTTSSRTFAEGVVDQWLELPPPTAAAAPPNLPLGATASLEQGLTFNVAAIKLNDDLGGAGSKNGRIEPGEWISLTIPLRNRGPAPWVSMSARWTQARGGVWLVDTTTHIVELPAGAETEVDLSLYVPTDYSGQTLDLALQVSDSHRAPEVPVNLQLTLPMRPYPESMVRELGVDIDEIGQSTGGTKNMVSREGSQLELFAHADLAALGTVIATESWVGSTRMAGIVKKSTLPNRAPMEVASSGGGTQLSMGDDADIWFVTNTSDYDGATQTLSQRLKWATSDDAGLPFRVDIDVAEASSGGAPAASYVPSAQELRQLVRTHLTMQPVMGTPEGKEVARVTDFGLTLDDKFDDALCALQHPQQPSACNADRAALPYLRLHQYVWLPIDWAPEQSDASVPEEETVAEEAPAPDHPAHLVAISLLGAHFGTATISQSTEDVALSGVGIGLRLGRTGYFFIDAAGAPVAKNIAAAGRLSRTTVQAAQASLGGGYSRQVSDRLALMGDIGLQVSALSFQGDLNALVRVTNLQARLGAAFFPLSWLSVDLLAGGSKSVGSGGTVVEGRPLTLTAATLRGGLTAHFW